MTARLWDRGQVREFRDGDAGTQFFRARHFARVARIGLVIAQATGTLNSDTLDGWALIESTRVDASLESTLRPARGTEVLGLEVVL